MREIDCQTVKAAVKKLFLDCNFKISDDISHALNCAYNKTSNENEKSILKDILENHSIAQNENIAICQDTGMAIIFCEYGDSVICKDFNKAVNEGVKEAYIEGYLRKSVVDDPVFARKNTLDNTPAIIYTTIVPGDNIKLTACAKGFGSENMSRIKMFNPTSGIDEIEDYIVEVVKKAGPNPCPPVVVGVGIGGTFEKAALLSKKATTRNLDKRNENPLYAESEKRLLKRLNELNIGCAGLLGEITALSVNIEYFPTHIAGLPVAVNISCHATRHSEVIL